MLEADGGRRVAVASEISQEHLAEIAVKYGFLEDDQLQVCRDEARRRNVPLLQILAELNHVSDGDLTTLRALAALKETSGKGDDSESLSMKVVERGFATGEQVEKWLDEWGRMTEPRPSFSQFLLHHGLLSTVQIDQLDQPIGPAPLGLGSRFGKYRIDAALGEGSAGCVFKALDLDLQRTVAVKVLKQTESMLPQHLQRFFREAKIMANLRHPHIVPVYEVGMHDGRYYFTMDYLQGRTLEAAFAEKQLGTAEVVQIVETLARALDFAHQNGVIHRDLKPSNIFLDGAVPKIMDFGLAKNEREDTRLTRTGTIMGSPVYMSPEQIELAGRVDARIDVYALGIILYEGVTGKVPFDGPHMSDLFAKILEGDPPPPQGVPPDLEKVILKAIHRDPGHRYETAGAFADDLKRFREGEPVTASGSSQLTRFVRRMRRQKRVLYAAGAAAVFVLMLVAVFELVRAQEQSAEATLRRSLDEIRGEIFAYDNAVISHTDDVRAAVPRLNRALAQLKDLSTPEADLLSGKILMRLGRRKEAEARFSGLCDFDRAFNLLFLYYPEAPPVMPEIVPSDVRLSIPMTHAFSGRLVEAVRVLQDMENKSEGREQAETRRLLGILQGILREYDAASETLEKSLAMRRADPDLLWLSGQTHFARPHPDDQQRRAFLRKSIDRLEQAVSTGLVPASAQDALLQSYGAWARLSATVEAFDDGTYRRAAALFDSVAHDRRDAGYFRNRAALEAWRFFSSAKAGNFDKALFAQAESLYRTAVELEPDNPTYRVSLASLYSLMLGLGILFGELDETLFQKALDLLQEATALNRSDPAAWAVQLELEVKRLQYKFSKGTLRSKDFEEARDRAKSMPAECAGDYGWLSGMGALHAIFLNAVVNRGQFDPAACEQGIEYCERATRVSTRPLAAWVHMATLKFLRINYLAATGSFSEERVKDAVTAYEEALKLDPNHELALGGLGSLLSTYYWEMLRRGTDSNILFEQAQEKLLKGIQNSPSSLASRFSLVRLHLMRIDHRYRAKKRIALEDFATAQRQCDELLAQNPGLPQTKEVLAFLLYRKCQYEAREQNIDFKDMDRAVHLNEELLSSERRGPALCRLGGLYELKNEFDKALEYFDQGIPLCTLSIERASALLGRGRLLLKMNQPERARKDLQAALALDPQLKPEIEPLLEKR